MLNGNLYIGYGDPASANYKQLAEMESLNFRDTFIDLKHVKESFPGATVSLKSCW